MHIISHYVYLLWLDPIMTMMTSDKQLDIVD